MNIEDKVAIQELNCRYALYADCRQFEDWVGVFAPDGVLDEREFGLGRHAGHAELRAYGQHMEKDVVHQVHLMTNHLINAAGPDSAQGTVFALVEALLRPAASHMRVHVRYEDQYIKLGNQWKFKSRVLRKTFPPEVLGGAPLAGAV